MPKVSDTICVCLQLYLIRYVLSCLSKEEEKEKMDLKDGLKKFQTPVVNLIIVILNRLAAYNFIFRMWHKLLAVFKIIIKLNDC